MIEGMLSVNPARQQSARWNVGIVGSGLVTRSIHLPTLAGLSDRFAVRAIWDVDAELAGATAASCGARTVPSFETLLEDPELQVIAICSPAQFHAEQAIAALRAGAKAVLVEKPLCSSIEEASAVADAARETGGMVIVGAMHMFDPAWQFMQDQVSRQATPPGLIRSSIILPPNARFDDWSSEPIKPVMPRPPEQRTRAMLMRASIMGLAIHDLPLVRRLLADDAEPEVLYATRFPPFGHIVSMRAGAQIVDLFAFMHRHWRPEWTLTATASDWHAHAEFSPSFVHAGSGSASMISASFEMAATPAPHNGYVGEWLAIDAMLTGTLPPPDPDEIVRDFAFAHTIAEQAAAAIDAGDAM